MSSSRQDDPIASGPSGSQKSKTKEDNSLLGSSLRTELLSEPSRGSLLSSRLSWLFNPRAWIVLVVLLAIIGCGWLFYAGPGRPTLENVLYSLAQSKPEPTSTPLPTSTMPPATSTLILTSTPTVRPTSTTTATSEAPRETETLPPDESPSPVPTQQGQVSGCTPAEAITLADLGEELCVTGKVVRTEKQANSFLIVMVDEPATFYFVSYDRVWESLKPGACVMATGLIRQLLSSPVMIVGYSNELEDCP
jgi:hypothetical protein